MPASSMTYDSERDFATGSTSYIVKLQFLGGMNAFITLRQYLSLLETAARWI